MYAKLFTKECFALRLSDFRYVNDCVDLAALLITKKDMQGVIVTLNKGTREFSLYLEQEQVTAKDVFFVDCISMIAGLGAPPLSNCIAINNPTDYDNILFNTLIGLKRLEKPRKFVMLVASRVFLNYNNIDEVVVFFKTFTDRLRQENVMCIITLVESGNTQFESLIGNLTDITLNYEEWIQIFA